MAEIFLKFVNMSITAGWLILAVIIFRLVFPKMPKRLRLVFWGLVGLRLILFASVESMFSLIPSTRTIPTGIMYMPRPEIHSGLSLVDSKLNPVIAKAFAQNPGDSANALQILVPVLAMIWLAGVIVMLALAGIHTLRLCQRVKTAVLLEENIYQSEKVFSPFVFGFLHPRIYLPMAADKNAMYYVILHEQMHIARRERKDKIFAYLLLSLYWFNPLCWAAYRLFCQDIELACDEQVIKEFHAEERADYSEALLSLGAPHRGMLMCPLAFGETGIKERVKHVLHYKKPMFLANAAAVIACIIVAVCFLANPKERSALKEEYRTGEGAVRQNCRISFTKEGAFRLSPSLLSSYIVYGSYEAAGGRLTLWGMGGEWYFFDMVGDTLVFDADASTQTKWWKDGDVFE